MRILLTVFAVTFGSGMLFQETVREMVRRTGNVELTVLNEYEPAEMTDLVQKARLIVRVIIQGGQSRLSENERSVVTDYNAQVVDVIRARVTHDPTITVRKPGGTITVEGRLVIATESDFPPFTAGDEYILFLTRSGKEPFEVVYGGQGAFHLSTDTAIQMSRFRGAWQKEHAEGKPVRTDKLLNGIQAALASGDK